ncbi:unnamed protein product, partial [Symbiodinium necroappetens]
DLGLMIVDEEQHFGVKQKERLKQLRAEVHVLTLTATPIPRTLQLALAGVKEMSLIAILREYHRGGQSFYVCPRVEDLEELEERLAKLVPEVKVAVAHGRMAPSRLEETMTAFIDRKYDVLLSTNIVESGLDIPTANTMVIHRADMFGLAQLYQLRGRIGRGKQRGYAYLTLPPGRILSSSAEKRLHVMQTLDTLGAGFTLASHDMDIRGEAVAAARERSGDGAGEAQAGGETWTPQINLGTAVLIPESYVRDLHVRLGLYRRLSQLVDKAEIDAFAAELVDRFGPLPEEVQNLLDVIAIKRLCRDAGVEKVDAGPKGAVVAFRGDEFPNPQGLVRFIQAQAGTVKLRPDHKLVYKRAWESPAQRMRGVRRLLEALGKAAASKVVAELGELAADVRRPAIDHRLDVADHGLGCGLRIAAADRGEQLAVLHRAALEAGLVHPQGLLAGAEGVAVDVQHAAQKDRLQRAQAGGAEDGQVEGAVKLGQGVGIADRLRLGHALHHLLQRCPFRRAEMRDRPAHPVDFQSQADARHLGGLLRRGGRHEGALVAVPADQSLLLQAQQRLAHRALTAVHRAGDLLFEQRLAGADRVQQDGPADRMVHRLALAARRHRGPGLINIDNDILSASVKQSGALNAPGRPSHPPNAWVCNARYPGSLRCRHRNGGAMSAALLEVDDLVVEFKTAAGWVRAVDRVSWDVAPGEIHAVVGESGSGKSVTALSILRLLPTPPARIAQGAIRFDGADLLKVDEAAIREIRGGRIGMVFQEPMTSLNPVLSIGRQLTEGIRAHLGLDRRAARARAIELLELVGISEPAQILELLQDLCRRLGVALVIITHNLGIVARYADRVTVMYAGGVVEEGSADDVYHRSAHPYTVGLLNSVPRLDRPRGLPLEPIPGNPPDILNRPAGCQFRPRCGYARPHCAEAAPPLERVGVLADAPTLVHRSACFESARLLAAGPSDEVLVELRGLKKHFPVKRGLLFERTVGAVKAVDGVSLSIRRGETLGLVGESGCGKSTIGRCLLRLETPSAGEIRFAGQDVAKLDKAGLRDFRRRVQAVFQDPFSSLNPRMTVEEIISEPLLVHGVSGDRAAAVRGLLDTVGLPARLADHYPHEMSGGQRQRVGIARALALKPEFIVCDEAVSALDVSIQAQIIRLLEDLRAEFGLTYLFIGHDLSVVRHICHRVAVMYLGNLVELADTDALFDNPQHPYTQALLSAVPVPDPELERARAHRVAGGEIPSPMNPPSGCAPNRSGPHGRLPEGGLKTMVRKTPSLDPTTDPATRARVERELREAYDFDRRDPLFGLSREALRGPRLERRSVLRLLAAAGTLSAWHLLPGSLGGAAPAAAQSGGTLRCGWSGVGEIVTLDPAQINQ